MSNPLTFDEALFRTMFPAFADPIKYPAGLLQMYWDETGCFIVDGGTYGILNGDCTALAMSQLTAHFLELAKLNRANGTSKQGGFKTGSSIDKVSVQYLAPPSQSQFDWWLNQTNYGAALLALLDLKSVGGFGVGGLNERGGFRKFGGVFF
jgi:Protein of unknown function (DUF4054)